MYTFKWSIDKSHVTGLYYNPTIDFIGAVDDSVGGMSISDEIHTILLTVEGPFWSNTKKTKVGYLYKNINIAIFIYYTILYSYLPQ